MIKVDSSFKLSAQGRSRWFPSGAESPFKELALDGIRVSLEIAGRTFDLSSQDVRSDDGFRSRGFGWTRNLVPLTAGMMLEQQMLLANDGNTVALSWRLTGHALTPVQLTVKPVFNSEEAISHDVFEFEPETNGGRLTWQPYRHSGKIVADTNGRCSDSVGAIGDSTTCDQRETAIPAAFEFDLGRHPAILILSAERPDEVAPDPIIGGFLAQLANPPIRTSSVDYLQDLAAA